MTREKRNKIVFLIAIFGIILILITAVSVKIEKQSGNINVISKLGENELSLISDDGEYEDTIYIDGMSYYLSINLDNFKGSIYIISE